jgi:hypothetical protein
VDQSTAVCVIGPGRAGTSLTMRVLNLLGVDVGPVEGLVEPGPGGPKGFWERREIIKLNDRLLRSQGGSWRSPPDLPPGWEDAPELEKLREEARGVLARSFAGRSLWGWKDPRVSLTAAFWRKLVPELRFVVCVRNPIDAADSLAPPPDRKHEEGFYYSRRGFGGERAYRLWATYLSRALANTEGRPRMLVSYEEYFDNLDRVTTSLARFAGCPPPALGDEASRSIEDFVDPDLRHYMTSTEQALCDDRLPPEVAELYREAELLRVRQDGRSAVDAPLEHDPPSTRGS